MSGIPLSEAQFSEQVLGLARAGGWTLRYHTHDSRGSGRGWPDWVLANPEQNRVVVAELKADNGRLSAEQYDWLQVLWLSGLEVALWRPKDLPEITRVLTGREAATLELPKHRPAVRTVQGRRRRGQR